MDIPRDIENLAVMTAMNAIAMPHNLTNAQCTTYAGIIGQYKKWLPLHHHTIYCIPIYHLVIYVDDEIGYGKTTFDGNWEIIE